MTNTMTKNEMQARIDDLEKRRFYLSMKDCWDADDHDYDRKMFTEALELKKAMAELVD